MTVALLVITDGRDEVLAETMHSLHLLIGPFTRRVLYDDTGDPAHMTALSLRYPGFEVFQHPAGRQGFGGAIRTAWRHLHGVAERFVWHHEDDFVLSQSVDVRPMMAVLDRRPNLAQIVLKRQPWNPQEMAAGGIIEQHPHDYSEMVEGDAAWTEHRRFWSTNPCLYRCSITARGWPDTEHSEGHFSADLFADPEVRCAFWGRRDDPPLVHHIGRDRAGTGY